MSPNNKKDDDRKNKSVFLMLYLTFLQKSASVWILDYKTADMHFNNVLEHNNYNIALVPKYKVVFKAII